VDSQNGACLQEPEAFQPGQNEVDRIGRRNDSMRLEAPHVANKSWQTGEHPTGMKGVYFYGRANLFRQCSSTVCQHDGNPTTAIGKSIR
jgi:hypothetical protein